MTMPMLAYKRLRPALHRMPNGKPAVRYYSPLYWARWTHKQLRAEGGFGSGIYACLTPDHHALEGYAGVLVRIEVWGYVDVGENGVIRAEYARIVSVLEDPIGFMLKHGNRRDINIGREPFEFLKWLKFEHCTAPAGKVWYVIRKDPPDPAEVDCARNALLGAHPRLALEWAEHFGADDDTRALASKDALMAYNYARYVDKRPHPVTRRGACREPRMAYLYARDVDRAPCDETRNAVSADPETAYAYAINVERYLWR